MSHQYAVINETVYFGFVSNDTGGSAVDGSTPLFDVREAGATASDAPILSGTPSLLTNAAYGPGCYEVAIAATTGNGFAAGSKYLVFVTVTADAETPGSCLGSFTIDPCPANITEISDDAPAAANLETAFDGGNYDIAGIDISVLNTAASAIGSDGSGLTEAGGTGDQLTAINLPNQTMDIVGSITGSLSGSVGSVSGNVGGDVQGNVDGSVASVLGGINTGAGTITTLDGLDAAQDTQHAATQTRLDGLIVASGTIGATGNDTTHVHLDGLTYGDDEINGYYLAINDVSTGETHVREITDWADTGDLATVDTLPFTPQASTDLYWVIALQAAAGGSAPTAAQVADAVWQELQGDHTDAGTFGEVATEIANILTDTGTTLDNFVDDLESRLGTPGDLGGGATIADNLADMAGGTFNAATDSQEAIRNRGDAAWITATGFSTHDAAAVRTEMDANSTQLAAIVEDTNELQSDDIPGAIAGLNDPTAAAIADAVWNELQADHVGAGSFGLIASEIATIDGIVDAIKVSTDNLPSDPADQSLVIAATDAIAALIGSPSATVADDIASVQSDTTAILEDTGTTLQAELDGIQADTEDIQTRLPAALVSGRMDANVSAINDVAGAAPLLEAAASVNFSGTASGTPTTTTMVSDIGITVNDQFNGRVIIFDRDTTTAALRGQATDITGGTAASNTLAFTALTTAPVSGDTFQIV